ncbi:hypothetical protein TWF506_010557 [Arthrobotrys conoides]|uniref:Uncharacterized protein n=1 Tax=Arthrobotrys conoides TaxID=74498 RepID=A0AAN8NKN3_9PEZI
MSTQAEEKTKESAQTQEKSKESTQTQESTAKEGTPDVGTQKEKYFTKEQLEHGAAQIEKMKLALKQVKLSGNPTLLKDLERRLRDLRSAYNRAKAKSIARLKQTDTPSTST